MSLIRSVVYNSTQKACLGDLTAFVIMSRFIVDRPDSRRCSPEPRSGNYGAWESSRNLVFLVVVYTICCELRLGLLFASVV